MKIEYQCSNCGRIEITGAGVGIPEGMYGLNYRAVGDALYCPECVKTWAERSGREFDDDIIDPPHQFAMWWNKKVGEAAKREGKTLKKYRILPNGDCVEA